MRNASMILHLWFSVRVNRSGGWRNGSNEPFRLVPVVATNRRGCFLVDCAGRSVQRKRRGFCVGYAIPGAVKTESGVGSAGRNVLPCLASLFAHRHVCSALHYGSIPRTGNGLSVGKGPGQRPVAQSGAPVVLDGDGRSELAGVLRRARVGYRAAAHRWRPRSM